MSGVLISRFSVQTGPVLALTKGVTNEVIRTVNEQLHSTPLLRHAAQRRADPFAPNRLLQLAISRLARRTSTRPACASTRAGCDHSGRGDRAGREEAHRQQQEREV